MNEEITRSQLETLKSRFRAAGYRVEAIDDRSFEIQGIDPPVHTHVLVTPYYLQLSTFVLAVPRRFMGGRRSKLNAFLSASNLRAKLVKFTVEANQRNANNGWPILATVKLITGVTGVDYDAEALKNMAMLYFQDIAELIEFPDGFELFGMGK
jgi:hypothetical protein